MRDDTSELDEAEEAALLAGSPGRSTSSAGRDSAAVEKLFARNSTIENTLMAPLLNDPTIRRALLNAARLEDALHSSGPVNTQGSAPVPRNSESACASPKAPRMENSSHASGSVIVQEPSPVDLRNSEDLGALQASGNSPTPDEEQARYLAAILQASKQNRAWRSCLTMQISGSNLVTPDGSVIPLREVEIEDVYRWPNTRFRFRNEPKPSIPIPKREKVLLTPRRAQEAVLNHLREVTKGQLVCDQFAFDTTVPLPRIPHTLTPFATKMSKFLVEALPEYLATGKRPICEEAKHFISVLPDLEFPRFLEVATAKKLDINCGASELGDGFPPLSEGCVRSELEKRKAFFNALTTMCLVDSLAAQATPEHGPLISAISKGACQTLADTFFSFITCKSACRIKVLKNLDTSSIPVADLLKSDFFQKSLFDPVAVSEVTTEARRFNTSIRGLLLDASKKRREEIQAGPSNKRRRTDQSFPGEPATRNRGGRSNRGSSRRSYSNPAPTGQETSGNSNRFADRLETRQQSSQRSDRQQPGSRPNGRGNKSRGKHA